MDERFLEGKRLGGDVLWRYIHGFAVGDAFGLPHEFKQISFLNDRKFEFVTGSHDKEPGTISDDTSMLLATSHGGSSVDRLSEEMRSWFLDGRHSMGEVFDIGINTYKTLFQKGDKNGPRGSGAGAICRVAPSVLLYGELDVKHITLTNVQDDVLQAAFRYEELLLGRTPQKNVIEELKTVPGGGYVKDVLVVVEYIYAMALEGKLGYEDTMLACLPLTTDTDTVCALVGGLWALAFPEERIPIPPNNLLTFLDKWRGEYTFYEK